MANYAMTISGFGCYMFLTQGDHRGWLAAMVSATDVVFGVNCSCTAPGLGHGEDFFKVWRSCHTFRQVRVMLRSND